MDGHSKQLIQRYVLDWDFLDSRLATELESLLPIGNADAEVDRLCRLRLAWFYLNLFDTSTALKWRPERATGESREVKFAQAMIDTLLQLLDGRPELALESSKMLSSQSLGVSCMARAEILRGRVYKAIGDFELAERALERARFLLSDSSFPGLLGAAEYQLGIHYKSASEIHLAQRAFERAISSYRKAGLVEWTIRTRFNQLIAHRKLGFLLKASEEYAALLSSGHKLARATKYLNEFARLHLALEDDHQVRKHLEMIAQATDEHTPIRSRVITYEVWADYHKLRGEWPEALAAIDAGLELAYKISEKNDLVGELLRRRARALYELERNDEAFAAAKRSLEVCERVGEVYEIGALFRTLGLLAERRKEPAEAENLLLKAVEFYRDKDEKYERAFSHMALAGFYERAYESRKREDDLREAFRHMASALGLFDEMGIPSRIQEARAGLDALSERLPSKPFTPPDGQTLAALGKVHGIISGDASIAKLLEVLDTVAPSDAAVLITGETGTGKELFARAVHKLSGRKGDLVIVNCAAIPDELMESELFGHLKGSFTGAHRDRAGKFAQADKGTLFLDEIGDLSPRLQAKLLRVLQDGIYSPVGSDEDCHADVRVVSATNRDLAALVARGRFRRDLLYRLNHVVIALPALRDRGEDAVLLTRYFIHEIGTRLGRKIALDPHAEDKIREYPWPGNVRELQSLVGRMALFARDTGHLSVDLFPESVLTPVEDFGSDLASIVLKAEKDAILAALTRARGNKAAAARILGVSRSTLNDKIARLNLSAERIARAARA